MDNLQEEQWTFYFKKSFLFFFFNFSPLGYLKLVMVYCESWILIGWQAMVYVLI